MTCPDCQRPHEITLIDGENCCSWCPRFRAECEARFVLAMPTKAARRRYLYGSIDEPRRLSVQKVRGEKAASELESLVIRIWEKGR